MITGIALLVVVAIGGLLAVVATRPDSFRIERSTVIQAQPVAIFALINDLHRWEAWSPWEKVDPALTRSYGGAPSGVGATYAWAGNRQIGAGRMEIIASVPPAKVTLKLDFSTPFEAHNTAEFTLDAEGNATRVTHAMFGPSPFMSKLMGMVFSMDKMVGGKFEEGLANLKALAEK